MNSALTNAGAMSAVRSLTQTRMSLDTTVKRVGSGLRVQGAIDSRSDFAIAQGLRTEIRAWDSVKQGLGQAAGLLGVSIADITSISNQIAELKKRVIEYDAADTNGKAVIQNDVNKMLAQIDSFATDASFNNTNIIDTDQANVVATQPPDEGITQNLVGNGSLNIQSLGSTSGFFSLSFTVTGGTKNIELSIKYNGSTVDSYTIKKKDFPGSGALTSIYPASPTTTVDVEMTKGNGASSASYTFDLATDPISGVQGSTNFQIDPHGTNVDIQSRSHKSADLGLGSLDLTNPAGALAALDSAAYEVNNNLGYYGAKFRQVVDAMAQADRLSDAYSVGLGNIVDADLGRESAKLAAHQIKEQLSLTGLATAGRRPNSLLGLLSRGPP